MMSLALFRHFSRVSPKRGLSIRTMATKIVHWDSKTCPYAQRSWWVLELCGGGPDGARIGLVAGLRYRASDGAS